VTISAISTHENRRGAHIRLEAPGRIRRRTGAAAPHRTAVWPGISEATPPLPGFLTRPNGPGRFPAVMLLHWCSDFSEHDTEAAATRKSWGYAALAIDSLGDANMCTLSGSSVAEAFVNRVSNAAVSMGQSCINFLWDRFPAEHLYRFCRDRKPNLRELLPNCSGWAGPQVRERWSAASEAAFAVMMRGPAGSRIALRAVQ